MNPLSTWVYFFCGPSSADLSHQLEAWRGIQDHYEVLDVVPVCGATAAPLKIQSPVLRLETPIVQPLFSAEAQWLGNVRHLHYTPSAVRAELQKRSAVPYPPSENTVAVLIPIRKSAGWWNLAHDERQKYFEKKPERRNHTAIGYDYARKIYRKLYHARYLDKAAAPDYDFLTYFEFQAEDRPVFQKLLHELRDLSLNPEWQFVDYELEIWLKKTAVSSPLLTAKTA